MTSSKGPADSNGHLNDSFGSDEEIREDDLVINFKGISAEPREDGAIDVVMETNRGDTPAILHPCEGQDGVVMFIGGGSDLKGPAGGVYERLSKELTEKGVTSMRVGQRQPDVFVECVGDALAAISFLKGIGAARIALIGHSSNGAVAIKSANFSTLVTSVASLAGQTFGAQDVSEIAPRNLLVIHGKSDQVLPYSDAQRIYDWAKEPKELIIYDKAGHSLNEIKEELYDKLVEWVIDQVGPREQIKGA